MPWFDVKNVSEEFEEVALLSEKCDDNAANINCAAYFLRYVQA